MYATLLERYNPGMSMDEEEKVRLPARRLGMVLPEELSPGTKDCGLRGGFSKRRCVGDGSESVGGFYTVSVVGAVDVDRQDAGDLRGRKPSRCKSGRLHLNGQRWKDPALYSMFLGPQSSEGIKRSRMGSHQGVEIMIKKTYTTTSLVKIIPELKLERPIIDATGITWG